MTVELNLEFRGLAFVAAPGAVQREKADRHNHPDDGTNQRASSEAWAIDVEDSFACMSSVSVADDNPECCQVGHSQQASKDQEDDRPIETLAPPPTDGNHENRQHGEPETDTESEHAAKEQSAVDDVAERLGPPPRQDRTPDEPGGHEREKTNGNQNDAPLEISLFRLFDWLRFCLGDWRAHGLQCARDAPTSLPHMQIVGIRVFSHTLVSAGGTYQMSISSVAAPETHIVEILTDEAITGYGEVCPLGPGYQAEFAGGARAAIVELAPQLIGLDPTKLGLINHEMDRLLHAHNYAKSAIDLACWDILGKSTDRSVADLLGGSHTDRVRSYWGIMPDSPEATATKAASLVADGYLRLQLKTGGRPLHEDVAAMHALAEVCPPGIRLLADTNRGWTVRDALEFSIACKDIPLVLEQPCSTVEEHRALMGRTHHPVFLDESSTSVDAVVHAISSGIAQGFGMKLSRVGGLTKLRAVRDICQATSTPLTIDDTWGGDLVASATTQMGSTVDPALYEGTWISAPYMESGYPVRSTPIEAVGGHITIPTGPGLGVDINTDDWDAPVASFGSAAA